MIFIVVDFPAPLGPKNPTISPFPTDMEIPSTARCAPYNFVRFFTSIDIQRMYMIQITDEPQPTLFTLYNLQVLEMSIPLPTNIPRGTGHINYRFLLQVIIFIQFI